MTNIITNIINMTNTLIDEINIVNITSKSTQTEIADREYKNNLLDQYKSKITARQNGTFFKHLIFANQTYYEHFCDSFYYFKQSFYASFYFLCHALYPDIFEKSGSETIYNLNNTIDGKYEKRLSEINKELWDL